MEAGLTIRIEIITDISPMAIIADTDITTVDTVLVIIIQAEDTREAFISAGIQVASHLS